MPRLSSCANITGIIMDHYVMSRYRIQEVSLLVLVIHKRAVVLRLGLMCELSLDFYCMLWKQFQFYHVVLLGHVHCAFILGYWLPV